MAWSTFAQVSVTNGSDVVTITSSETILGVVPDSALLIQGSALVEVEAVFIDGGGNRFLRLRSNWSEASRLGNTAWYSDI